MRPRDNTFVQEIQSPAAPDAATHDEIDFALAKQQENHRDAIALIREAHAIQVASLEEEIKRLTKERDAARKGLFHRLTGWDKDGQTPDQILDELQQLRNTVALLRSKPEVEALAKGLQDFAYGRVKSLTEIDAIERAERAEAALQSRASHDWQPIETAPKDGSVILLCKDGSYIQSGSWNRGGAFHMPHWSTQANLFDPTHWMPLPSPPSIKEPT